jgi:hypothetical protein
MAADKYLKLRSDGLYEEVPGTIVSAGAANGGELVATNETTGKLDESVMPDGVSAETEVMVASEALDANDVVNVYDDSGTRKCRKADATDTTKPAHGYVKVAVLENGNATIYTDGKLPGTGLTVGARYFLSETAGQITAARPTTDGALCQAVGTAVAATAIKFDPEIGTKIYNPA